MKFSNSIDIALPRESVAQLLADPAQLPKWLRGMVIHEPVSGVHGHVGTTSRVVMQSGDRTTEMTETITRRDPVDLHAIPKDVVVHFERETATKGMWSVVRDRLTEVDAHTTHWVSDSEYRLSGVMMRLVGLVMPGAFRKQTQAHMQDFKDFAEQGKDVREG